MTNRYRILFLFFALVIGALFFQRKVEVVVSAAKASDITAVSKGHEISRNSVSVRAHTKKAVADRFKRINSSAVPKGDGLDLGDKKLLCKLKLVRTNIPMEGDVQIFITHKSPFFGNEADNAAWIKASSCPEGTYSIIHFSDDGRASQEINCRNATLTDIATMSGEQGNIADVPMKDGEMNLAISGNGYFVLSCPNGSLILTRDGKFRQNPNGDLTDKDNCTLLNQHGTPFQNLKVNSSGCHSNGECVATVDPSFDEISGLEYLNNYSFQARDVGPLMESVTKNGANILRPSFFVNALEDVHNPARGLTSVSWSNQPHIRLSDIDCE